jgi:hypothetical protein
LEDRLKMGLMGVQLQELQKVPLEDYLKMEPMEVLLQVLLGDHHLLGA